MSSCMQRLKTVFTSITTDLKSSRGAEDERIGEGGESKVRTEKGGEQGLVPRRLGVRNEPLTAIW